MVLKIEDQPTGKTAARTTQRLFVVYLSALAFLFTSVLASVIITQIEGISLANDAKEINLSGRQRMLSQRIIYLAQDLALNNAGEVEATREALSEAITSFEDAISLFETSHQKLSLLPDLSTSIRDLYFSTADGPSLDARVRSYIVTARALLEPGADGETLARLKEIEQANLLQDLDRIVSAFELESRTRVAWLHIVENASLLVALAIIFVEVVFVFLPGHRLLRQTFLKLEKRTETLVTARQELNIKNAELEARNRQTEEDRKRLHAAWTESEEMRTEQAEFTYAVSHDLKSPTNTIHLLLGELSGEYLESMDEEGQKLLIMALATTIRMGGLIDDVLEYSWAIHDTAEAGWVDMEACVAEALAELEPDLEATGAEIEIGQLARVFGYQTQLRFLVQNLVSNAIKFQEEGNTPRLRIFCERGEGPAFARLVVEDNGIGIAPENQERIFGLFQRLHVRENYPGTGLGLTTCNRIARNHNGRIEVSSRPNEGSTFTVWIGETQAIRRENGEEIAA